MSEVLFCPNCGARQGTQARFCFACGHDLMSSVPGGPTALDQPVVAPQPVVARQPAVVPPPVPVGPHASTAAPAEPHQPVAPPAWSIPKDQPQFGQAGSFRTPAAGGPFVAEPGVGAIRPTGIAVLAILEVVGGLIWLIAAKVLFDLADWNNYWYGNPGYAQILGLVAGAAAIAGFAVAWGFWSVRRWAWMLGCSLAIVAAALAVLSLAGGGNAGSAVINVGINAAVLYYLNTNVVRGVFGRPPTTFMQMQGPR